MLRNINKRTFFTLFAAVTISGFIVICTLGQDVRKSRVDAKMSAATDTAEEPYCVVRITDDGRLGIFRGKSSQPYRYIETDTALLSDHDRLLLADGVELGSEQELKRFIEDFT